MSAITDRLAAYRPPSKSVTVVLDGELLAEVQRLTRQVDHHKTVEAVANAGITSKVPELEKQLAEAKEAAAEQTMTIVVQAIPQEDFADLQAKCPPTAQQLAEYKVEAEANPMYARPPLFDVASFAPLLLDACGVGLEPGDAEALWTRLPPAEAGRLYEAALELNWTVDYDPKTFETGTV